MTTQSKAEKVATEGREEAGDMLSPDSASHSIVQTDRALSELGGDARVTVIVDFLKTEPVSEILSYMSFELGRYAELFRLTGDNIKRRAEAEQSHVMSWMLALVAEHGEGWRDAANDEIARRCLILESIKAEREGHG